MSAPTPQQKTAIDSDGNVLVMAGAGAGKTSTLVARILDRTLDSPHRTPINRLLVVTFNEAAAAEMRHRLGIAFDARLRGDPDNTWIAEQRALLDTAFVSTLHAFCLRLVREHFHELDLDPQFSVQDAIQTRIQRQEVLSDLLRSHLENSPAQSRPIRAWLTRHARDQLDRLRNRILEVHEFARSLPEPRNWLEDQLRGFRDEFPHRWVALAGPGIAEWASSWIDHAREVALLDHSNRPAQICVHALGGLADTPQTFSHLECLLADVVEAGDATGAEKKQVARWLKPLKKLIGEADALLQFLAPADPSVGGPNALSQDWEWCRHDAATLLELVNEFDHAFAEARRAAAVVDFADLEQLALRLLWDSETRQPSRLALQWQADLDHVFVDEVQDINGAQDRILQCLSRTGARSNRFLVGDVKQSIYRFRRADPRIFQTYARDWRSSPHHAVAPLTDNFRSHQAILHFVNEVFRPIMRKCAGGIVYDADAELQLGAPADRPHFRDHPDGRVEFHLLVTHASDGPPTNEDETTSASASASTDSSEADDETGDLDAEESQAKLAAHRLRALRDSASPVWDASSRATRPVQWRDMVVLHPAPRSVSERWARAFANEDVPLDARRGGFFESLEVSDLVQLVRLLDNPRQDLPLLAVLRSPLVQMSVDELALLRILNPTLPLWPALQALARPPANPPSLTPDRPESPSADPSADPELGPLIASARAKAHAFLEAHSRWRRIATQGSLAACLETVLAETDYEARLLAQDRADAKRANLHRLLGLSRQFDSFQRHGLFRFIQFLESQASSAETLESAPAASGDSVRLLSIHQSKGLEFPIVVVAGLGRRFNEESLRSDWLLDPDFGVCPPVVPDVRASRYPSLPRWLAGHRQRHELLGEQIRLLYVAFTRAAERLLLIASARESRLAAWSESGGHIPTRSLLEARSPIDWLGPLLPGIARADDFYSRDSGRSGFLDWRLWRSVPTDPSRPADLPPSGTTPDSQPTALRPASRDARLHATGQLSFDLSVDAPETRSDARDAGRRLTWQYPWLAATREAAKAAVTALRQRWRADEESAPPTAVHGSPADPASPLAGATSERPTRRRESGKGGRPNPDPGHDRIDSSAARQSAIERGLTHHLFNERVDLAKTRTVDDLVAESIRLESLGWLSPEDRASLDFDGLAGFWQSPLAETLRAESKNVERELPFTASLRVEESRLLGNPQASAGFSPDDYQVIQGVIDLALIRPEEIWIVDFKTDHVTPSETAARAAEYGPQLRIYAHAVSRIYRRPVTGLWLYFFSTRELVPVPAGSPQSTPPPSPPPPTPSPR